MTVLEQLSQVMGRAVPEPVAAVVAARHTQSGVSLFCNTEVVEICQADSGFTVTATDGFSWRADLVIARIGEVPETQLAEECGLEVENGIRVNGQLRTSNPDIYPAVYCCLFPHSLFGHRRIRLEMWRGAREQAEYAARNLIGGSEAFEAVPWFWSNQFDLTLQVAGLPGLCNEPVVRQRPDGVSLHFELTSDGRLVSVSEVGEGNSVAKDMRLGEILIISKTE